MKTFNVAIVLGCYRMTVKVTAATAIEAHRLALKAVQDAASAVQS